MLIKAEKNAAIERLKELKALYKEITGEDYDGGARKSDKKEKNKVCWSCHMTATYVFSNSSI